MRNTIAVAALFIILGLMNWSIYAKEKHLATGKVVYLELAPVDPRSLMQGDYMALRFELGNKIQQSFGKQKKSPDNSNTKDGQVIVTLDEKNIASFYSIDNSLALTENQLRLNYRVRSGRTKFATNAFFFQEGHAEHYESAGYGQFRVNSNGDLLLTGMFTKDLVKIDPK